MCMYKKWQFGQKGLITDWTLSNHSFWIHVSSPTDGGSGLLHSKRVFWGLGLYV